MTTITMASATAFLFATTPLLVLGSSTPVIEMGPKLNVGDFIGGSVAAYFDLSNAKNGLNGTKCASGSDITMDIPMEGNYLGIIQCSDMDGFEDMSWNHVHYSPEGDIYTIDTLFCPPIRNTTNPVGCGEEATSPAGVPYAWFGPRTYEGDCDYRENFAGYQTGNRHSQVRLAHNFRCIRASNGRSCRIVFRKEGRMCQGNDCSHAPVPPQRDPCCASRMSGNCCVGDVNGSWKPMFSIATNMTYEVEVGTEKSDTKTQTDQWNQEVSTTVSLDLSVSGFGVSSSVGTSSSCTIGQSMTQSYSSTWTTNEREKRTAEFGNENVGKFIWQFEFDMDDPCLGSNNNAKAFEFAITQSALVEPCCIPGFAVDIPTYSACCTQEYLLANADEHCQLAKEYEEYGTVKGVKTLFVPPVAGS
jgi:hypothetical protein